MDRTIECQILKILQTLSEKECSSINLTTICLTVTEAGTWGEVADQIQEVQWFDTAGDNPDPYATTFYNVNQARYVSGITTANTTPCTGGGGGGGSDTITAFEYAICDNGTQKIVHVCLDNCNVTSVSYLSLARGASTAPVDWNVVTYGSCDSPLPEGAATEGTLQDVLDQLEDLNSKVIEADTTNVSISNFPSVQSVIFGNIVVDPQAPDGSDITTSSGVALAANAARAGLIILNVSAVIISISFGADAAVLYNGITLYPGGGWEMDSSSFTLEAINAIGASAASNALSIQEWNSF